MCHTHKKSLIKIFIERIKKNIYEIKIQGN